jgi:hypothetical protein
MDDIINNMKCMDINIQKKEINLMDKINPDALQLINNNIIRSMSIIDWGKTMARPNEIIQKDLLKYCGIDAFDPDLDIDCPAIDTSNNSPGFDILVKNKNGELKRIQSKMRQVRGLNDFSQQVHFETTRRHSKKNSGPSSDSGHVAYSINEFDYVMITLINVRCGTSTRNDINNWSFSIIPINELINKDKKCCLTSIPPKLLKKYKYKICPESPYMFN